MVLSDEVLTTANSEENTFIETNNLVTLQISSTTLPVSLKKPLSCENFPKNNSSLHSSSLKSSNRATKLLRSVPKTIAMQNCSTNIGSPSSNSEESISTTSSRGLKMKIKRRTGATKAEDKHEIVNSCDIELRDKKPRTKRERNRVTSGNNSSSECDPYEFGAKTDDDELPVKKLKLEKTESSHATKEVGINACTQGTMTEPDLLGPCEPGSSICLNGIVWLETDTGMLVINVTWRNRTYIGTLLDSTKHEFAPPLPQNYVSPFEPRNPPRGRGKRRGGSMAQYYRSVRGKGRGGCRVITPSPSDTPNDSDDDSKRGRSRRSSPADSSNNVVGTSGTTNGSTELSFPLACPTPNCCKRFADLTALRFHLNQLHTKKHNRNFAHNHQRSPSSARKDGETPARRRSPTKKKDMHQTQKDKLNNHMDNGIRFSDRHSRALTDVVDENVFKTPSSASLQIVTTQKVSPISTGQSNCVSNPLPLLVVDPPHSSTSPTSVNIKPSVPTSHVQHPSPVQGIRTVTAHTVAVPVDKNAIPSSPVKQNKKSDDHKKNNNVKRSIAPANFVSNSLVTSQRPIAPSTTGTTSLAISSVSVAGSNAQVIALSATVAKPPVVSATTCSNLKPIQPKPVSSQTTVNLNSTPTASNAVSSSHDACNSSVSSVPLSSSTDKKPKKRRLKSSDTSTSAKKPTDTASIENKAPTVPGEICKSFHEVANVNGISPRLLDCDGGNKSKQSADPYEVPASPAYSDISDANDSPAPVLEKEVDVKAHGADRPGPLDDVTPVGPPNSVYTGPGCYFSQPPSLVPAITRSEKPANVSPNGTVREPQPPATEVISKEKQEETRQIMKDNHGLKAHVSVTSSTSGERRAESLPKKEPPALTKVKEDAKVNSLASATDLSKTKDSVIAKRDSISKPPENLGSRPRSSEGIRRNKTPTTSPSCLFPPNQLYGPGFSDFISPASTAGLPPQYFDQFRHFTPTNMHGNPMLNPMGVPNGPFEFYPPVSSHPGHASMPPPSVVASAHLSSAQHKIHELAEQAKHPDSPTRSGSSCGQNAATSTTTAASRANSTPPVSMAERGGRSPADAACLAAAAMAMRQQGPPPSSAHPMMSLPHMFAPHVFGAPHGPGISHMLDPYMMHGHPQNLPLFQPK